MPTRFADIPMPEYVKALPATSSGMPVPYTTLYLPEDRADPTRLEQHPNRDVIHLNRSEVASKLDRRVRANMRVEARAGYGGDLDRAFDIIEAEDRANSKGMILECSCEFGVGRPQFGKPCVSRQRKAMWERRCVVCGRRIKDKVNAVFLGPAWHPDADDPRRVLTSIEPPAHAACAAFSALTCRRLADNPSEVRVATVRDYQVWQRVALRFDRRGQPIGPIQPLSTMVTEGAVDLYIGILDHVVRNVMLDEWMARHAPAPYRGMSAVESE